MSLLSSLYRKEIEAQGDWVGAKVSELLQDAEAETQTRPVWFSAFQPQTGHLPHPPSSLLRMFSALHCFLVSFGFLTLCLPQMSPKSISVSLGFYPWSDSTNSGSARLRRWPAGSVLSAALWEKSPERVAPPAWCQPKPTADDGPAGSRKGRGCPSPALLD